MSETPQEQPPTKTDELTMAEVAVIAEKASKDALEAKSIAEAKTTTAASVTEEAAKQGKTISDEDAKAIADQTVETLKSLGAFDHLEPEPAPATETPAEKPAEETAAPPAPGDQTKETPAGGDDAPGKRTFAERFLGK